MAKLFALVFFVGGFWAVWDVNAAGDGAAFMFVIGSIWLAADWIVSKVTR